MGIVASNLDRQVSMALVQDPKQDAPLGQGDILVVTALFGTMENGEGLFETTVSHALVISRNCAASRERYITVAPVKTFSNDWLRSLKDMSLKETRQSLAALRDGDGRIGHFYLGSLKGGSTDRLSAELGLLHCIEVPTTSPAREIWVAKRRLGTLTAEHRRNLHICLLQTFGREGFDDFLCWPDADLSLIIAAGNRDVAALEMKLGGSELERQTQKNPAGTENGIAKNEEKLAKVKLELKCFKDEQERRKQLPDG